MSFTTYARLRERFRGASSAERRVMIETGAAFANFSIMTPTEDAERTTRRWIAAGRPTSLVGISKQLRETRERRLRSVAELNDLAILMLGSLRSPHVDRVFAGWTWGFGPVKASFAMACAGLGTLPCLDRRFERKYAIPRRELTSWDDYLAWCERLWPDVDDKATAAAEEWVRDLAHERYATQHELLLGEPAPQLSLELAS